MSSRPSAIVASAACVVVLAACGSGGGGTGTPQDSTAASPRPTTSSSAAGTPSPSPTGRTGTPPATGGEVPAGVPETLAAGVRVLATSARGFAGPVRSRRVATTDGTTCRLTGVPLCRVGAGIAVTGYCPPPAQAEVVAVVVTRARATPVCGGVPLPSGRTGAGAQRLPNGQVTLAGRAMRCAGLEAGVLCVDRDQDAGFFLSLDGYRVLH